MMKPRSSRVVSEQANVRNKSESLTNGPPAVQRNQVQLNTNAQTSAQAIRKRRSSINVYDQPSSLNSRLRQLETDMLRLDEDRTKLFDDTHSALAQYELRLNEIHAILKSRQDNVDKYVEDMRLLLQAKEDFEKQAKMLHEKHDRVHEKFMHRETTISREIKLLKNKFELLEKSRQFRTLLQKSGGNTTNNNNNNNNNATDNQLDDSATGLDSSDRNRNSETASEVISLHSIEDTGTHDKKVPKNAGKNVRIKLSKLNPLYRFMDPVLNLAKVGGKIRRKSNRISSISVTSESGDVGQTVDRPVDGGNNAPITGDSNSKQKVRGKRANILCRLFR